MFARGRSRGKTTRLFFASDLHGSDVTFRKFVNAARFYDVDALVFGGDLMGKALVPIVRDGATYRSELLGVRHELDGGDELKAFQRSVETTGFYWAVMDGDEHGALATDRDALDVLFDRLARERLAAWIAYAEERLAGTEVRCFLTGGNDDTPSVLEVLDRVDADRLIASEHQVVELDDHHTMITVGYSTPTPWDTPREASEEQIAAAIEASVSSVPDPSRCVFNLHSPPIGSGLDRCIQVDARTDPPSPMIRGGQPVWTVAGSRSVRDAVALYQPVVGLHGHVHESPGRARIGRTPCFNPGSEYSQGVLSGLIVSIRDGRLVGYQHTTG